MLRQLRSAPSLRSLLTLGLLGLCNLVGSAQIKYPAPFSIPTTTDPSSVLVTDIDGDGHLDIIAGFGNPVALNPAYYSTPPSLGIYLYTTGGYHLASTITLPANTPPHCLTGDFNGDGRPDIACSTNTASPTLLVYLGHGDGTFGSVIQTPYPSNPTITASQLLAVGDLNHDGNADIFVNGTTFLGDGTGHFTGIPTSRLFPNGSGVVIRDVNGDGIPDILAPGPTTLLGHGDGTFTRTYGGTGTPCVFADFEHTGGIVAACGPDTFFRMDNTGQFTAISVPAAAYNAQSPTVVAAADFNSDGNLDLLLDTYNGTELMLGHPGFHFDAPIAYAAGTTFGQELDRPFIADMNGDGYPDLVSPGVGAIYISYGGPATPLSAPVLSQIGTQLYTAFTGYTFSPGGTTDIVTIGGVTTVGSPSSATSLINLIPGQSNGSFGTPIPLPFPSGYTVAFPSFVPFTLDGFFNDATHEGFLLPVQKSGVAEWLFYQGAGDRTFSVTEVTPAMLPMITVNGNKPDVQDLNGDNRQDIVTKSAAGVVAYLSNGGGSFTAVVSPYPTGAAATTEVRLGDFNNDNKQDAALSLGSSIAIMLGKGDGTFTPTATRLSIPLTIPGLNAGTISSNLSTLLATGDYDRDGNQDIAALTVYTDQNNGTFRASTGIVIFYGDGHGGFSGPVTVGTFLDRGYSQFRTEWLNYTGLLDLIASYDGSTVSYRNQVPVAIFRSLPGRSWAAPTYLAAGDIVDYISVTDLNHDGTPDIFVSNGSACIGTSNCTNTYLVLPGTPTLAADITGTLTITPEPSAAGASYTAKATFASTSVPTTSVTGNITFTIDSNPLPVVALSSNSATATISTLLTPGTHTITATWPGNSSNAPLTLTKTHTINGISTMTTASGSPNPATYFQPITFSAHVANNVSATVPTGTVTFTDTSTAVSSTANLDASGNATLSGTATSLDPGTHPITVTYNPTGNFAGSSTAFTEQVNKADPVPTLTLTPATPIIGSPLTVSIHVAGSSSATLVPSGTVRVIEDGVLTTPLPLGTTGDTYVTYGSWTGSTKVFGCAYLSDTYYNAANCADVPATSLVTTTATIASSLNPSPLGQSVTFTSFISPDPHVTNPGTLSGSISFYDGATLLANVPFGAFGCANCTTGTRGASYTTSALSIGSHTIKAVYNAGGIFLTSSASLTQVVYQVAATAATLTSSLNPSFITQPVTFTAKVASVDPTNGTPTGSITFSDGALPLSTQTLVNGAASYTVTNFTGGTHNITATYTPPYNFAAASAAVSQVVKLADTTSVLTLAPTPLTYGTPFSLVATVTPSPVLGSLAGSVSFSVDGVINPVVAVTPTGVATYSISALDAGTHAFACHYTGDANDNPSNCAGTSLTIAPSSTLLKLTTSGTPVFAGNLVTFTAQLTANAQPLAASPLIVTIGNLPPVALTTDASGTAIYPTSSLAPGTYNVTVNYTGTTNYNASSSSLSQVILVNPVRVTLSATPVPAYQTQSVTLTAETNTRGLGGIAGGFSASQGSVSFFDGTTPLGTSAADPNTGTATLSLNTLSVGRHLLTAVFTPTNGFVYTSSTSNTFPLTILPSAFTLTLTPTTLVLPPGAAGSTTLQLTSIGAFSGPVTFSNGTLPQYAKAAFSSSTATLTSGGSTTATLSLTTLVFAENKPTTKPLLFTALALLLLPLARRRKRLTRLLLALAALTLIQPLTGCTNAYYVPSHVAAGTYSVPVTATDSNHVQQTAILTVIVQK